MTDLTSADTRRTVYRPPLLLADHPTHYCPGCGHGIVHRLVAELLEEMRLAERTIGVASVGCSVFAYDYLAVDFVESPHGRAPAVATGVRRARPDAFVFTYQGDGDLAAIGTAEIVHAAARGERISAIFVNNGIYGMTGGQMAPTTLLGQKTTSSPSGRDATLMGYPIPITEMLALNRMPEEIQERCRQADIVSKSMLLQVVRQETAEEMHRLLDRIAGEGMSRDDARKFNRTPEKAGRRAKHYTYRYRPQDSAFQFSLVFRKR